MKLWECLPCDIANSLEKLRDLRELRLRDGKPVKVNVGGKWFWLGHGKLVNSPAGAPTFENGCADFIKKACNSSVYAYEKMLAKGFFTMSDGCRVGVCGVMSESRVFRQYTSLCIRIAKNVSCAQLFNKSVIVAGPPGSGKTTFLRDFAAKLSSEKNVVVVDERGEISSCGGFENFCDVFLFAPKSYAFETAVRSMSPDWIVCDELSVSEIPLLQNLCTCGVKVAASIHAENLDDVKILLGQRISFFGYAVLLSKDSFSQSVLEL